MKNHKIFCFDLDNTICKTSSNLYKKSTPIKSAINIINKLFDKGHKIIIFTARGMGTYKGDIKKVKKKYYKFTFNQLQNWKVKFHKLYLGKPSYDYIIDDKSINYKPNWKKNLYKYYK